MCCIKVSFVAIYFMNWSLVFYIWIFFLSLLTDQPNDALATALSEVTAGGGMVAQNDAGAPQVKDPLSALAAAAELDQVRNDVAVVSVTWAFGA